MYVFYEANGKKFTGGSPSTNDQAGFEIYQWDFHIYHPARTQSTGSTSTGVMQIPGIPITTNFHAELIDLINATKEKQHIKASIVNVLSSGDATPQNELVLTLDNVYLHNLTFSFVSDGNGGRSQRASYYIDQVVHKGKLVGYTEGSDGKMSAAHTFDWNYEKVKLD
jgi:hypothetical protein